MSAVETSGLRMAAQPDGGLHASLERLALHGARLRLGPADVEVGTAQFSGVAAALRLPTDGQPFDLLGLTAQELRLQQVVVSLNALPGAAAASHHTWQLQPIAGLDGRLHAYVTDAAWVMDAEVTLPIHDGRIDFGRVTVEHVGPDSSMGVSHMGVYVDAPTGRNYLFMFQATHVPGAQFERRGALFGARVTDRGSLELRPFVECLLASGTPLGRAPHHVGPTLDRTRLSGDLHLGDGTLGNGQHHVTLAGHAQGKNRVGVSAAVLSHELMLRLPELVATGAAFELKGRAGRAGAISGALSLRAIGRAKPSGEAARTLVLNVAELTLRDLVWGDVGGYAA